MAQVHYYQPWPNLPRPAMARCHEPDKVMVRLSQEESHGRDMATVLLDNWWHKPSVMTEKGKKFWTDHAQAVLPGVLKKWDVKLLLFDDPLVGKNVRDIRDVTISNILGDALHLTPDIRYPVVTWFGNWNWHGRDLHPVSPALYATADTWTSNLYTSDSIPWLPPIGWRRTHGGTVTEHDFIAMCVTCRDYGCRDVIVWAHQHVLPQDQERTIELAEDILG